MNKEKNMKKIFTKKWLSIQAIRLQMEKIGARELDYFGWMALFDARKAGLGYLGVKDMGTYFKVFDA